jgi:hypothetical protein
MQIRDLFTRVELHILKALRSKPVDPNDRHTAQLWLDRMLVQAAEEVDWRVKIQPSKDHQFLEARIYPFPGPDDAHAHRVENTLPIAMRRAFNYVLQERTKSPECPNWKRTKEHCGTNYGEAITVLLPDIQGSSLATVYLVGSKRAGQYAIHFDYMDRVKKLDPKRFSGDCEHLAHC